MTLPTEILSLILKAVGSEEFSSRLEMLTVCKAWYQISQPVMLKDLTLSAATFIRFPPISPKARQLLRTHIRTLSVQVPGCGSKWSHPETGYDGDGDRQLVDYAKETNLRVQALALFVPEFTLLSSLNFRVSNGLNLADDDKGKVD